MTNPTAIPDFDGDGFLPPGIHWASWEEVFARFGQTTRRRELFAGILRAAALLEGAGCTVLFLGGSFVTAKAEPEDFDGCWSTIGVNEDLLDPVLLDFADERAAQKATFLGELFPAEHVEGASGLRWVEFFQHNWEGARVGIVAVKL